MKRFVSVCAILILLVLSTACGSTPPASSQSPDSPPVSESAPVIPPPQSAEPAPAASSESAEPAPVPDSPELAALLRIMRDANTSDPNLTVDWNESESEEATKLRITNELFSVMANVLATEPYSEPQEYLGASYPEGSINVMNLPASGLSDGSSSLSFDIVMLSENPENGEYTGKMIVQYSSVLSDEGVMFSYPRSTYEKLTDVLQPFINAESVTVEGTYTQIDSGYLNEAGAGDFVPSESLQFDNTLLIMWYNRDSETPSCAVEAVDVTTGKSLYHFISAAEWPGYPHMEKAEAAPYDYRINYKNRIEYRSSADKDLLKTVYAPDTIKTSLWDSTDFEEPPFDADLNAGLFAYSGADGIYLCGMDGSDNRQILSNADIPAIIVGNETPEHGDSQLHYALPLLMNGGKQLVATAYLMTNGNYDTAPVGVTVVDLDTGEKQSRADIAWLTTVQRLTLNTVGYIGGGDVDVGNPGFVLWDTGTNQTRGADFDWHEAYSFDYKTFIQVFPSRNADGESVNTLSSYTLEQPDDKKTLLTVLNGRIGWNSITEDYVICAYDDDLQYEQSRQYAIVPYN